VPTRPLHRDRLNPRSPRGDATPVGDEGAPFWITSPERTVVDVMRLTRVVGRDQAVAVVRRYLERPGT
jgi:hypothetical protein